MATYGTDLAYLNDGSNDSTGDTGTETSWTELTTYDGGGAPAEDDENFIQGNNCISQTTGSKSGLDFSIVFNAGSDQSASIISGMGVFIWQYASIPEAIETFVTGGMQIVIAATGTTIDRWITGGSDFGRFPYGGWQNNVVTPNEVSPDNTDGGGSGGTWQYFGSLIYLTTTISKGSPHACDAVRYGRGEIYCSGIGCDFTGMAQYNDYNDVTNGYNRFGLFQAQQGSFLWKGLMSLGQTGASATFSDSNKSIFIDYTPKVYAAFNKIEINNSGTSVTWNNISIKSLGTVSKGQFEMVDNATVALNGCTFTDMSTFTFLSNATINDTIFNACGQISHGGADFDSCTFQGYEGISDTAYLTYAVAVDPDGELDNCSFTKGTASTHAIEFDATNTPTTITLRGIDFSGYNASNGQTDSTLYFPSTTKSYTVNLVGCTGNISYKVGSGGSVNLVIDPVTLEIEVTDIDTLATISGVTVLVEVADGTNFPYQDPVTISGTGFTAWVVHSGHGLSTNDYVVTRGVSNDDDYNGVHQITVLDVDQYIYTTDEEIGSSPATGTPIVTFAPLFGYTDADGLISDTRTYANNQLITGKARKADGSPYYKQQPITGEIDNAAGLTINLQLISDE